MSPFKRAMELSNRDYDALRAEGERASRFHGTQGMAAKKALEPDEWILCADPSGDALFDHEEYEELPDELRKILELHQFGGDKKSGYGAAIRQMMGFGKESPQFRIWRAGMGEPAPTDFQGLRYIIGGDASVPFNTRKEASHREFAEFLAQDELAKVPALHIGFSHKAFASTRDGYVDRNLKTERRFGHVRLGLTAQAGESVMGHADLGDEGRWLNLFVSQVQAVIEHPLNADNAVFYPDDTIPNQWNDLLVYRNRPTTTLQHDPSILTSTMLALLELRGSEFTPPQVAALRHELFLMIKPVERTREAIFRAIYADIEAMKQKKN